MNGKMTKKARAEVRFAWTEGFAPSRDSSIVHEIATTRVTRERKAGMSFVMNGYIGMLIVKLAKSNDREDGHQHPEALGLQQGGLHPRGERAEVCPSYLPVDGPEERVDVVLQEEDARDEGPPEEEERDLRPGLESEDVVDEDEVADEVCDYSE